jgi:magnesium-transporting ATPase (P-type)
LTCIKASKFGLASLFSFWQEYRSERALAALRDLLPQMVAVDRGGALIELPASELVPGDVIRLHEGDSVPADFPPSQRRPTDVIPHKSRRTVDALR